MFTSSYERLRAFTSSYECLRACPSALGRASSRYFSSRVRACLGMFERVKMVFSGMAGKGRLRHWLGKEGSSLLRIVLAPGAGRKK